MNDRLNPLASIYRWPTPSAKAWTASFVEKAQDDENIFAVIAIGSAVRPAVQSVDLDLIVICQDPTKIQNKPPIEIDLRVYAAMEVPELVDKRSDLFAWALMFGKPLFQRDGYWNDLLTSLGGAIPLPSFEVAQKRAVKALKRLRAMLDAKDQGAASEMALSYLTHLARAQLLKADRHPKSRPELASQLRELGIGLLADDLELLIKKKSISLREIDEVVARLA